MKVIQVIASVSASTGGTSQSVTHLSRHLAQQGNSVHLISLDYSSGSIPPVGSAEVEMLPAGCSARHFRGFSRQLAASIRKAGGESDVIHNHGLWMWPNLYARSAAVHHQKPLVISPRGMLDPWARRRGRLKKAVFWQLFERENLARAAMFHATSVEEAHHIRQLRLNQPIAVIPNAVDLPELDALPPRSILEESHPELRHKRWLLFLSRLHEKKGIRELLSVWQSVQSELPDWHLVVAGDYAGGGMRVLIDEVRRNASDWRVTLTGHIDGAKKAAALRHAELFVLPSYSENYGIAIAEALAHGTPVVTTTATPWSQIMDAGAGWCVEPGETALRRTLPTAMKHSPEELAEMGVAGRMLICRAHTWDRVAREMSEAYHWLTNRNGSAPSHIAVNGQLGQRCE